MCSEHGRSSDWLSKNSNTKAGGKQFVHESHAFVFRFTCLWTCIIADDKVHLNVSFLYKKALQSSKCIGEICFANRTRKIVIEHIMTYI